MDRAAYWGRRDRARRTLVRTVQDPKPFADASSLPLGILAAPQALSNDLNSSAPDTS